MARFSELCLGPLESVPVSVVAQPGVTLMSLVADALGGRSQGVHPTWRRALRSAVPEGAEAVLRPLFTREYSMVPDCLTPTAPLWETDLSVQLDREIGLPQGCRGGEAVGDHRVLTGEQRPQHRLRPLGHRRAQRAPPRGVHALGTSAQRIRDERHQGDAGLRHDRDRH